MLILDTPNTLWKSNLKAHSPINVAPDHREHTNYHMAALQQKEPLPNPVERTEGSAQGLSFRIQREAALNADARPAEQPKQARPDPTWRNDTTGAGAQGISETAAQSEISSAAKALWQQYVALLSGRPVGPLPMSVINACASYGAAKQIVAA